MKASFTIKKTLFFALLAGIIVPMLLLAVYTLNAHRDKLYDDFSHFRKNTTLNISRAMQDPLYYFSPNNASLVLEIIKRDRKISKIEVYDALSETHFIIMDFPDRQQGASFINQENVVKDGEVLGWVKIQYDDIQLQKMLSDEKIVFIRLCLITILASILILAPLIYAKILAPLKKLLHQSMQFENNEFDIAYIWEKNDEISLLGQSFDKARLSIIELIAKLRHKNKELKQLYATDQLTSLFNRYKLNEVLDEQQALKDRDPHYQFGIILLDLDHFKQINDEYGHLMGDHVLQTLASILKSSLRNSDIAGRWGGEEFMLIIPNTDGQQLEALAHRIRKNIASHSFSWAGSITASFGTTIFLEHDTTQLCIARVDRALYQAKANGRNTVVSV